MLGRYSIIFYTLQYMCIVLFVLLLLHTRKQIQISITHYVRLKYYYHRENNNIIGTKLVPQWDDGNFGDLRFSKLYVYLTSVYQLRCLYFRLCLLYQFMKNTKIIIDMRQKFYYYIDTYTNHHYIINIISKQLKTSMNQSDGR